MDNSELQIIKSGGETITWKLAEKETVNHILRALNEDGFVVLKNAARSINVAGATTDDIQGIEVWLESEGDIHMLRLLNSQFVKAILNACQDRKFDVTHPERLQVSREHRKLGRDPLWEIYAEDPGIVAISCTYLGGEESTIWVVEIDRCLREEGTDNLESLEINGRDMFGIPVVILIVH